MSALAKSTRQTESLHLSPEEAATGLAAISHNDQERLLRQPRTTLQVQYTNPTSITKYISPSDRYTTPPPQHKRAYKQTIPLTKTNGNTPHKEENRRKPSLTETESAEQLLKHAEVDLKGLYATINIYTTIPKNTGIPKKETQPLRTNRRLATIKQLHNYTMYIQHNVIHTRVLPPEGKNHCTDFLSSLLRKVREAIRTCHARVA